MADSTDSKPCERSLLCSIINPSKKRKKKTRNRFEKGLGVHMSIDSITRSVCGCRELRSRRRKSGRRKSRKELMKCDRKFRSFVFVSKIRTCARQEGRIREARTVGAKRGEGTTEGSSGRRRK